MRADNFLKFIAESMCMKKTFTSASTSLSDDSEEQSFFSDFFDNSKKTYQRPQNHYLRLNIWGYDAKKRSPKKISLAVQKKKSDESSSGMFQFYLKRVSTEGVCQIWLHLLTYPIAGDHNSLIFIIRSDKDPLLMTFLDRIETVHCRIHPTFFFGQNHRHLFF